MVTVYVCVCVCVCVCGITAMHNYNYVTGSVKIQHFYLRMHNFTTILAVLQNAVFTGNIIAKSQF